MTVVDHAVGPHDAAQPGQLVPGTGMGRARTAAHQTRGPEQHGPGADRGHHQPRARGCGQGAGQVTTVTLGGHAGAATAEAAARHQQHVRLRRSPPALHDHRCGVLRTYGSRTPEPHQ